MYRVCVVLSTLSSFYCLVICLSVCLCFYLFSLVSFFVNYFAPMDSLSLFCEGASFTVLDTKTQRVMIGVGFPLGSATGCQLYCVHFFYHVQHKSLTQYNGQQIPRPLIYYWEQKFGVRDFGLIPKIIFKLGSSMVPSVSQSEPCLH